MKLTFLSNYFNHHQRAVSDQWNQLYDSYYFVATSQMREERRALGYGESSIPTYVLKYEENAEYIDRLMEESDAVIIGAANFDLVKSRLRSDKPVFRYSERPFKQKDAMWQYIPRWIKWHLQMPAKQPIYMLCAGAYTAADYDKYGLLKGKSYKWGYFPETKQYDEDLLQKGKQYNRILWCGRFLDWKHPDDALQVADRLKQEGYIFELNFVGMGALEESLKKTVSDRSLEDCVTFLGAMSPQEVRTHMEQAGIFLFTSDRREGWGAVLNESMNSGCAVVASHAIGAVPYLIQNNENGMIYQSGNLEMLYQKVKYLLDHPNEQKRLGTAAYHTIVETWNAEVASKRFMELSQHILSGEQSPDLYESGPCSKAEIIKDDWFNA